MTLLCVVVSTGIFSSSVPVRDIDDSDITWAIWTVLRNDSRVDSHFISVQTNAGVVTLSGWVNKLLDKERAGKITESVKGVHSVVNRISVRPGKDRSHKKIQ